LVTWVPIGDIGWFFRNAAITAEGCHGRETD
jgi:hypothetical protein